MKTCAISQSNYIPWKGYFDLINTVDEFVLFDCVQYTRRDWRNRNKIKTASGPSWLSVPVHSKGNFEAAIDSILLEGPQWAESHWHTIAHNYARAPFFKEYASNLQKCYESVAKASKLSVVNATLIRHICNCLGITTKISDSRLYEIADEKTDRLLSICEQLGAGVYYSGPAAQSYFDTSQASDRKIEVRWMSYDDYPEYPQLFPPFVHTVSVLDLLFNVGPDAPNYMKSFTRKAAQLGTN